MSSAAGDTDVHEHPAASAQGKSGRTSLDYSLDYSTNVFIYGLHAFPVSLWACFSPAISPSLLPTNTRIFSVRVWCIRKMLLEVTQYGLSLPLP